MTIARRHDRRLLALTLPLVLLFSVPVIGLV